MMDVPPKTNQRTRNHRRGNNCRMVIKYSFVGEAHLFKQYTYKLGFDVRRAVHAGLEAWSLANPGLVFIQPPYKTRLRIKLCELPEGQAGLGSFGTFPGGTISVDPAKHHAFDDIRDTVAHEFGHIAGYGHSDNPDNLMYGERVHCASGKARLSKLHTKARGLAVPSLANQQRNNTRGWVSMWGAADGL